MTNTVKCLLIGDPHIKKDNTNEINLMTEQIINIISRENLDFVVILGDILHSHEKIDMLCLHRAYDFLSRIKSVSKELYIIIGNHDRMNNNDFLSEIHPFGMCKEWDNTYVIDNVFTQEIKGMNFLFLPYIPNGRLNEALEICNLSHPLNFKCVFSHFECLGCSIQKLTGGIADEWPINSALNYSGHIHDYEKPQDNLIYVGTPIQHNSNDSSNKYIFICEFDESGLINETKLELDVPKKFKFNLSLEQFLTFKLPKKYSFITFKINGNSDEIKECNKYLKYIQNPKIKIKIIDTKSRVFNSFQNKIKTSFSSRLESAVKNESSEIKSLFSEISSKIKK